jgi:predicted amidohydrolase
VRFIAVQTDPVWHDLVENRRRIEGALDASGFRPGDYLVLPEMCETAWTTDARALSLGSAGPVGSASWLAGVAAARRIWLQAGIAEPRHGGRYSNSVVVIGPNGVLRTTYRKNFLFPSERDAFIAGESISMVDADGVRVCPLVCYDLRFPELWRLAALEGAEVFAVSSSWPSVRHEHWRALLVARAIENQACIIAANRCGRDPSNEYAGGSVAIDVLGTRVAEADAREQSIALDFDRAALDSWRSRFGALRDARSSLLGSVRVERS